jgi:hypothetical protein
VRPPAGAFVASVVKRRAVLWAVGDGADGGRAAKALARRIARGPIDRLLYLGDVYHWQDRRGFAKRYGTVYGALTRITAPTPGNHDDPVSDGYAPFWRRAVGKLPPSFYSFSAAGWDVLSLNSEIDHGAGSAQMRWLRRRLRRPGTCRIAFWHRPRYSAGAAHGDQRDMALLWKALRGHAAIVVNGHEHDMQRFKPIDRIVEFVSGAGGHSHYDIDRGDRRVAFGNDRDWGALRLELTRETARYAFVADDGRTLDSGAIGCEAGRRR